jgi:hypothetical protein
MDPGGAKRPGSRIPVVRHFIACERIERSPDRRQCSLVNVIHAIQPLPGAPYPRIHPELCLFVQMTDGQGRHSFQLQLVFLDEDETVIHTTPPIERDLGPDPLVIHGWPLTLRNVPFPRPGVYEFRLMCDGREIAREPIRLRENP